MGSLTDIIRSARKKPFAAVPLCSLSLAAITWMALALSDYFCNFDSTFVKTVFFPPTEQYLPRFLLSVLFFIFGGYIHWIILRHTRVPLGAPAPEVLYETLLNTTPEAVLIIDPKGLITFVSPYGLRLFGYEKDELVGKSALELVKRDQRRKTIENYQHQLAGRPGQTTEYKMVRRDGSLFLGELSATLICDDYGAPQAVVAAVRDVSKNKIASEELQYRLDFERIITSLSSRFIRLVPDEIDDNIVYAIQTVGEFAVADRCYVFQTPRDRLTMINTHEWCSDGIEPQMDRLKDLSIEDYAFFFQSIREGKHFIVPRVADLPPEAATEKEEFEREGIQSIVCVPMIRRGNIIGFIGLDSVCRERHWTEDEITLLTIVGEMLTTALERETVERALRESEEKYRSFVQNFQGMAFRSRMDWVPLFFHGAVENITGYSEQELIAGNPRWDQVIHPDDWPLIIDSANKIATVPNYSVEREYRIIHKNGEERWIHELSQNICDQHGKPQLVQGAIYDITERKRMEKIQAAFFKISEATNLSNNLEELLKTIHHILGTLIDTTNFYVALYNSEKGTYSFPYLVDEYAESVELEPEELKKSLTDYVRKTGRPLLVDEKLHQELEAQGEIALLGEPSPIWLGVPLQTPHGVIGVVTVQSYHDPNLYEESDMDLVTFVSGHIAMAIERKQAEMLIRNSEEEHRTLVETMRDGVMKVDTNENIVFANPAACHILGYECGQLESLNLSQIVISDEMEMLTTETQKRLNRQRSRYELTVIRKDGEQRQVSISAAPYEDDRGNVVGTVGVFTDITELKKAQEEGQRLREKLANAQRMESLGVLAGGVAHDLNNILGPLVGYPELIKRRLPQDSPVREQIGKIEESAKRAAEIVQDLLTMGRRGRYEMAHTDINNIITSYMESSDFARKKSRYPEITISMQLDENIPSVFGSDTHLSKVIMNLALNALDAMPEGGHLTIKTECHYITQLYSGYNNIEPGRYNIITVSDTGIGIEEADTKRIFDPFFSKKKLGKSGSGLGLSVVYAVVKDHNGYVDVQSELGKGANFIIYLPALETKVVAGPVAPVYDIKGNESILVVDDVAEQRDLAVTLLGSLGYQMASVTNGHEAVEYLKSNTCDVLVLDMIMEPDFDGLDTYREIVRMHPGQKAVIVSGFSQTDRVRDTEKLGVTRYVKKPYTMQKLGKAIREVLANPSIPTEKIICPS